jgi:2-polyprenyl-3-methyl-5-hydroxy-6-metoxy-1,4-benzoquinol methylase
MPAAACARSSNVGRDLRANSSSSLLVVGLSPNWRATPNRPEPEDATDDLRTRNAVRVNRGETNRRRQRELVRSGYDAISARYRDDQGRPNPALAESTDNYRVWLNELASLLPAHARVLDLGCGAGVPATRIMVDLGFQVTGLDISAAQINRARSLVPEATFVHTDVATRDCEPARFEAIVSLYTLLHLPLPDQQRVIPRLKHWLTPVVMFSPSSSTLDRCRGLSGRPNVLGPCRHRHLPRLAKGSRLPAAVASVHP